MIVNEIFCSIEGEGKRAGYPCVFVRFAGCNLKCSYCDTDYAQDNNAGTEMTAKEIADKVQSFGFNRVTLTGGEPLLQEYIDELISELVHRGMQVNVETNGSVEISHMHISPKDLFYTVDYKCPSSGMSYMMNSKTFIQLTETDVLKFVVGSKEDMEDALRILNIYTPPCQIFFSPVFGKIEPVEIVDFIKSHYLKNVRVQLQLHKFIWDPQERGV